MSVVERLLREQKERETRRGKVFATVKELPLEDQSAVAVAIISELPAEHLHRIVTQLIRHVEATAQAEKAAAAVEASTSPSTPAQSAIAPPNAASTGGLSPHIAGRFILHGFGLPHVAPAPSIQVAPPTPSAQTTLSLSTAPRTRTSEKKTQRDYIREVLTTAGRALSTTEITKGVLALAPELKFVSVKSEVQRMRNDGVLIVDGSNGRGGLHRLAEQPAERKEDANGVT